MKILLFSTFYLILKSTSLNQSRMWIQGFYAVFPLQKDNTPKMLSFLVPTVHRGFMKVKYKSYALLLYISSSVWVLHTPNAGWNMLFNVFLKTKKEEKEWKLMQILALNVFFVVAPECWCRVLYPEKNRFSVVFDSP